VIGRRGSASERDFSKPFLRRRDLLGDSSSKMELLTARFQVTRPASVAHVRAMAQVKGTRVTRAARALPLGLEHKTGRLDARSVAELLF